MGSVNRKTWNLLVGGLLASFSNGRHSRYRRLFAGVLGDLGYYNIRVTLEAFGYEWPTSVSCHTMKATNEGVSLDVIGQVFFTNARSASFHCSFVNAFRQDCNIVCDNGILSYHDFVIAGSHEHCEYTVRKNATLTGKGDGVCSRPIQSCL